MRSDPFGNSKTSTGNYLRRRENLTFRGNIDSGRHNWLRLTPAYSLHLVRELLADCSPSDLILDPFSGTGTTVLVSAQSGIPGHAVDINPFLVWLGNLKGRRYEAEISNSLLLEASRLVYEPGRSKKHSAAWVPNLHQIEKWWSRGVLEELASLKLQIDLATEEHPAVLCDLLKVAFCRAMIETSNASFNHQSMSFKKKIEVVQESLFDSMDSPDSRAIVHARFIAAVDQLSKSLAHNQPIAEARVYLGDSRYLDQVLPGRRYTRVITSPPYPNRVSYIRELRPYMYWLGYLTEGRQAGELDWSAIGGTWGCATSNLGSWTPDVEIPIPFPGFNSLIASFVEKNRLLGRYVHKYFQDIELHLRNLRRVLAPDARCHYIVGNSKFYNALVPVEEIYAALMQDAGFTTVRIERLRKRNSKKELYEFVVSCEAPPN